MGGAALSGWKDVLLRRRAPTWGGGGRGLPWTGGPPAAGFPRPAFLVFHSFPPPPQQDLSNQNHPGFSYCYFSTSQESGPERWGHRDSRGRGNAKTGSTLPSQKARPSTFVTCGDFGALRGHGGR